MNLPLPSPHIGSFNFAFIGAPKHLKTTSYRDLSSSSSSAYFTFIRASEYPEPAAWASRFLLSATYHSFEQLILHSHIHDLFSKDLVDPYATTLALILLHLQICLASRMHTQRRDSRSQCRYPGWLSTAHIWLYTRETFESSLKVVVGCGNGQKTFYVTKSLICENSEFFKAACNERWESGRTNTITLLDDSPKIFSLFLTWLLTGDIENAEEYEPFPDTSVDQFSPGSVAS